MNIIKRNYLTKKEQLYADIIKSRNVLFLKGHPASAKSAIGETIANILGWEYIPLPLATADNVDLGQYPITRQDKEYGQGDTISVDYAIPSWALEANKRDRPTLIHFEELNRCPESIRNASLFLLNEKRIGSFFKFNDNVFMMASGNLGEEDGTEVLDMDSAMDSRVIYIDHDLLLDEWVEGFAKENILPIILNYLNSHPESFYKFIPLNKEKAFPNARTWTNLNNFFTTVIPKNEISEITILQQLKRVGANFVGEGTCFNFIRYLESKKSFSFRDVLNKWDKLKDLSFERTKISELIQQAKEYDLETLSDEQIENFKDFILDTKNDKNEDQFVGYANYLLENLGDLNSDNNLEDKEQQNTLNFIYWLEQIFDIYNKIYETNGDS